VQGKGITGGERHNKRLSMLDYSTSLENGVATTLRLRCEFSHWDGYGSFGKERRNLVFVGLVLLSSVHLILITMFNDSR
jgi:hypothetical protein